ncbi:helix-turn-helix domain-containing protein [Fulvivirgaceae bacterium PWU4]|uniref:Helix-turn-helix domain-containing protein n=1 Tax=Chryseosolibacter histidini TaxID=2782349 RepID=A0AAP2DPL4_9BACT|nr:helix-turn-helix domain-containing protein [Chryseosolibacter histidini]
MMGIKQEALAELLGEGWSQKKISTIETREVIEPELLEELAHALKVPAEAIKNFDEDKAIYNIQNNYEGSNNQGANNGINHYQCTFNPLDEIKRLNDENRKLYEALLKEKDEKIALMQRMLEGKGA